MGERAGVRRSTALLLAAALISIATAAGALGTGEVLTEDTLVALLAEDPGLVDAILEHEPLPALGLLGFTDSDQRLIRFLGLAVDGVQEYGSGNDPAGDPVLEAPGTSLVEIGTAQVVFPAALDVSVGVTGDHVLVTHGHGIVPDVVYTLMWARYRDAYNLSAMDTFANRGFVTSLPQVPLWESAFAGDTWWGGFQMPALLYDDFGNGPEWFMEMSRYDPTDPRLFLAVDFDGFAVLGGDTFAIGVATTDLLGPAPAISGSRGTVMASPDDLRIGYFSHERPYGTPRFTPGHVTTWPQVPDRGYDDFELGCWYNVTPRLGCTYAITSGGDVLLRASEAVHAPGETTTTVTVAPATTVATEEPAVDGGGIPAVVWLALVALAILALLGGLYLARRQEGDPCADLLRRWKAAEARLERLRKERDQAASDLEGQRTETRRLEDEIAGLERARGRSMTEGGVTYHVVAGEKVTGQELDYRSEVARRALDASRGREGDLQEMVNRLDGAVAGAEADAAEAKAAYDRCVGAATAERGGSGEAGPSGAPIAPGGTATAAPEEEPPSGCRNPDGTEGAIDLRPGETVSLRVFVDFSVIAEVEEASVHGGGAGKDLAFDLRRLAGELGLAGSLFGGLGAGTSLAGGVGSLAQGQYVRGSAGMARGTAEGLAAVGSLGTDSFPIPIPTSLPELATGVAQVAAQLGALVADKVTEWMEKNQIYLARLTMFYQTVKLRPVEVWECRGGTWHCREHLLEYDVGKLRRAVGDNKSFKLDSDLAHARFQSHLRSLGEVGANRVANSTKKLAELERELEPGPCR